jgi:hypothetical protein
MFDILSGTGAIIALGGALVTAVPEESQLAESVDRSESSVRKGWYELGPIRPPSEGRDHSLLIRATRNCPWNRCRFCTVYKGQRFQYRTVAEVKGDIDAARAMTEDLKAASWRLGLGGKMDRAVLDTVMNGDASLCAGDLPDGNWPELRRNCLVNVANWLASGGQTVFLQDADTTIMRTPELVEVLKYVRERFPSVTRVTSYARAKTLFRKASGGLGELRQAGLSRLHVGLESGADEVLAYMEKGVNAAEQTEAGRAAVEAGISLSEYVMPGLGGRKWSERHAMESARVLSQIDPSFIRLRSLAVRKGSPLYEQAGSQSTVGGGGAAAAGQAEHVDHCLSLSVDAADGAAQVLPGTKAPFVLQHLRRLACRGSGGGAASRQGHRVGVPRCRRIGE